MVLSGLLSSNIDAVAQTYKNICKLFLWKVIFYEIFPPDLKFKIIDLNHLRSQLYFIFFFFFHNKL